LSRLAPVPLSSPEGTATSVRRPSKGKPPPTTAAELTAGTKYLRGQIDLRPPAEEAEGGPAEGPLAQTPVPAEVVDPRPGPGDQTTFTETITAEQAAAAGNPDAAILRYVVVPAAKGRRLGAPSALLEFPLTTQPAPPAHLSYAYSETTLALAWAPTAPLQTFRVYRTDRAGTEVSTPQATAAPLTTPVFSQPVELGREACFVVRSAIARGPALTESAPAGPICVTPIDTFPPPAPSGLSGLPTETQIQLVWTPVTAPDLGGYVVLRSEDGAAPAALMPAPIAEASYTDANVRAGVHYTYTVVAVDKAGNRSQPSNPVEETR
jgi:hypothetical protein